MPFGRKYTVILPWWSVACQMATHGEIEQRRGSAYGPPMGVEHVFGGNGAERMPCLRRRVTQHAAATPPRAEMWQR